MPLSQKDPVHSLGVVMILLEEQMAVLARRAFTQLCVVHYWHLIPKSGGSVQSDSCSSHLLIGLLKVLYIGLSLKNVWCGIEELGQLHVLPEYTFYELRWFLVYF